MARAHDLTGIEYGLTTERMLHINAILHDYDRNLSLRRIPADDPAAVYGATLNPPKLYGVYEENVAPGQPNWVFTLAEMSIDERVIARVMENDLAREGMSVKVAKQQAIMRAQEASRLKVDMDRNAERREEQLFIGRAVDSNKAVRMNLEGRDVIIGDTIRPAREFISTATRRTRKSRP